MTTQLCTARSGSAWSRRNCGRPVKEGHLCAIHLAARNRVAKNDAKRANERERWGRNKAEREQQARDFSEALGIRVVEQWPNGGLTGFWPDTFQISGDDLRSLVARLRGEP